jgi:rhamnogalacturonan endolyase
MTVGDVDGDGKDEIFNGSSGINDDGRKLFANGLGHGDALHMSDMDPDRPGQEIWQCHETPSQYGVYGMAFKDAKTGAPIWGVSGEGVDIGRCNAADIDPRYKGYECWGSRGNLYDCKGNQIGTSKPSMNFSIWWDADLNRELLDGNHIDKWNHLAGNSSRLLTATDYSSNNTTKATPALSADLFGDWREEVILRKTDNTAIRIYTTNIATTHKLYTLMHDTQYRVAIAWQNSAYNQPPHPSFYLGVDMTAQTKPNIIIAGANLANKDFTNTKSANAILYPNPTSQTFTIKAEGQFTYTIHNVLGAEVGSGRGENQVEVGQIATASGLYIITVTSEKGTSTIKLIKE